MYQSFQVWQAVVQDGCGGGIACLAVKSPLERQQWIHPILHDRLTHGMLTTLYHSLRSFFFFFSRMPVKSFDDFSDSLRRAYLQAAPSDEGLYLSLVGVQPVVVSNTAAL